MTFDPELPQPAVEPIAAKMGRQVRSISERSSEDGKAQRRRRR